MLVVGAGISVWTCTDGAGARDRDRGRAILSALGEEEYRALREKWMGRELGFPPSVRYLGYGLLGMALAGGLLLVCGPDRADRHDVLAALAGTRTGIGGCCRFQLGVPLNGDSQMRLPVAASRQRSRHFSNPA